MTKPNPAHAAIHSARLDRMKSAAVAAASALLIAAALLSPKPALAADAFNALKGSWSGGGRASFASGQSEKLRCSARYTGGGANLAMNIKCASPSAQINLTGALAAEGNKVSGNWAETSFGLSGGANGSTSGGTVRLRISGSTTGVLTLNVAGNRHTFAVSSQGMSLTGVNVSMARR